MYLIVKIPIDQERLYVFSYTIICIQNNFLTPYGQDFGCRLYLVTVTSFANILETLLLTRFVS